MRNQLPARTIAGPSPEVGNQNSLSAASCGPLLLEDFPLSENRA